MLSIRTATSADAETVASIHSASRRIAYRGILSADYLANQIDIDARRIWKSRVGLEPGLIVLLAEKADEPVGFLAFIRDHDPEFGDLIDNFHILPAHTGMGIGRRLFDAISVVARRESPTRPMYLWVYQANLSARRVYRALGGTESAPVARRTAEGTYVPALRVTWPAAPDIG